MLNSGPDELNKRAEGVQRVFKEVSEVYQKPNGNAWTIARLQRMRALVGNLRR